MSETPGWSNSVEAEAIDDKMVTEGESKLVEPAVTESKAVRKTVPRKKV